MCKSCANHVHELFNGRGSSSTAIADMHDQASRSMDKPRLIRFLSQIATQAYAQLKTWFSPLFEQVFYPVSTAPIITKKR